MRMRERVLRSAAEGAEQPAQQRPVLNALTAGEARRLHRPLERRSPAQGGGLALSSSSSGASAPRTGLPLCLDEVDATPRTSIFDAQADWVLPPMAEKVCNKENQRDLVSLPWCGRVRPRGAGAASDPRRASARAVGGENSFSIFVDPQFDASSQAAASSSAAHKIGVDPTSRRAGAMGLSPPARRHCGAPGVGSVLGGDGRAPGIDAFSSCGDVVLGSASVLGGARRGGCSSAVLGAALSEPIAPDVGLPVLRAVAEQVETAPTSLLLDPGAPARGARRPRPREDAASDLALSLSGLRLFDRCEPPPKKVRTEPQQDTSTSMRGAAGSTSEPVDAPMSQGLPGEVTPEPLAPPRERAAATPPPVLAAPAPAVPAAPAAPPALAAAIVVTPTRRPGTSARARRIFREALSLERGHLPPFTFGDEDAGAIASAAGATGGLGSPSPLSADVGVASSGPTGVDTAGGHISVEDFSGFSRLGINSFGFGGLTGDFSEQTRRLLFCD